MKPKNKPKPAPAPEPVLVESHEAIEERQVDALSTVVQLQNEVAALERDLLPKFKEELRDTIEKTKQEIYDAARLHFDERQNRIVRDLYSLLTAEPVWETQFLPGTMKDRQQVEAMYRKGFRYMGNAYDQNTKTGGTLYHRPKFPKTFEEFTEMYQAIVAPKKPTPPVVKKAKVVEKKKLVKIRPKT